MRTRFLGTVVLLLAAAAPAQAGWFKQGWTPPEPIHPISGGFHKSDSAGRQVVRSPKEFKDPEWGRKTEGLFKHPARPLPSHLMLPSHLVK